LWPFYRLNQQPAEDAQDPFLTLTKGLHLDRFAFAVESPDGFSDH
jgi:hypothetical protein